MPRCVESRTSVPTNALLLTHSFFNQPVSHDRRFPSLTRCMHLPLQFEFHVEHTLHGEYHQKLNSKVACIVHVGKPPPIEPRQLGLGEAVSAPWIEQRAKFASFMVANFVPWEHGPTEAECVPADLMPEALAGWITHLEEVATGSESSGMECTIARGRLHAIRQWANGLQVSNNLKQVHVQYRLRNRTIWSEEERTRFEGAGNAKAQQADDDIYELHAMQRHANVSPDKLIAASKAEHWMEQKLSSMGLTLPSDACTSLSEPRGWGKFVPTARELGVANISPEQISASNKAVRKEVLDSAQTALPGTPPPPGPVGTGPATPFVMPAAFAEIDNEALARQNELWEVVCEAAKAAPTPLPPPPLGLEQRECCRTTFAVLHAMKVAHNTEYGKKQALPKRKDWMARAKATAEARGAPLQTQFLMVGPAGAGKTEVIKALHTVMEEEQMGTLRCSRPIKALPSSSWRMQ